jgi:hypothetical protein
MGIADGSWGETARVHRVNSALDVERREAQESAFTERGANVPGNERLVIAEGLGSELRFGSEIEPAVEVLVQGQILSGQFPALVAFFEPSVQLALCRPERATDGAVDVPPSAGLVVETKVNPHQPPVVTAGDDLTLPSRHASSFHLKYLAHNWHTRVFVTRVNPVPRPAVG